MLTRRAAIAGLAGSCVSVAASAQPGAGNGARVMTAMAGASLAGGARAPKLLGYDGIVPGPVLRGKQAEELRLRLVNQLAHPTTVHWHGIRLPNPMDGVPSLTQAAVAPGESYDYRFRAPDAGTFWYHAQSAEHLDHGLYGALIIEEQQALAIDRELILMLSVAPEMAATRQQDTILVNGVVQPDIAVERGERLRLRLVNATGARGFALQLEGHAVWGIAIDGEPCEPFLVRESRLGLGPGSRIDVCVDATLRGGATASLLEGVREQRQVARLVYGSGERPVRRSEPAALARNPLPARIDLKTALRADLTLARADAIAQAPIFTAARGRPVSLALRNPSGQPHVVHVHGHHFRLLDRLDDGWKPYWLDNLVVGNDIERIAFVADNPGKWLIEYRMLESAETGAVWFAVT
jgi:FtsP/CotA-like multicopper oxidase with cupredoxin domain